MNLIFADAFYCIAMLNRSDRFHAAAVEATRSLAHPLLTTAWILTEVADALSAPSVRPHPFRFLQQVAADPNTTVIQADPSWYHRGLILYGNRLDKSWSLTDCISFEVMNDHGVAEALTGDQHFVQTGFRALLLPGERG